MDTHGKFVWHELMTKDPEAALKFYGELFGWKFKSGDAGPMIYHEITVGDRQIGGITGLMGGPGQRPAWNVYVTVDKVDAAVERATRTGGKSCMPAMDIPNTGRFAMVADPSGAVIAPFTYAGAEMNKSDVTDQPGSFIWNELLTDAPDKVKPFYGEVFGWSTREQDMGPMGTYTLFQNQGKDVAGMMKRPADVPANFWMFYVSVPDVDAAQKKAVALGARAMEAPMDVPGVGRMATIIDPQGAVISLFKPEKM